METSSLALSNSLIFSVIFGQNGTLEKSIAELAMNSGDAGATEFVVDVTSSKIIISDNGKGFADKQQIKEWWATLGFEHNTAETQRMYGKYGMGRAQIMAFGSSVWHTNGFTMSIDVKNKGLEYLLKENQPVHQGLKIEVDLYSQLSTKEIFELKGALAKQLKYFPLEIRFNREIINLNPFEQKWTYETQEFWLKGKFSDGVSHRSLSSVYNIGVLVNSMSSYNLVGFEGEIVSKPGHALNLNISRDAILTQQCPLYAELMKFLRANSPKASKPKVKKATLTKEQRIEILNSVLLEQILTSKGSDGWSINLSTPTSAEYGVEDIYTAKLIPLLDGNISVHNLFAQRGEVLVTDLENLSREKESTLKEAYPSFRFTELKWDLLESVVKNVIEARSSASQWKQPYQVVESENQIQEAKDKAYCAIFKGMEALTGKSKGFICKPKDTPEAVRAALLYLADGPSIVRAVTKLGLKDNVSHYGIKLCCGVASTPETSWLSGNTIVIDAKHARTLLASGFPGFEALRSEVRSHMVNYNANRSDISPEFKSRLLEIERAIAQDVSANQRTLADFRSFVMKCLERKVKPFSRALANLEYFEGVQANQSLFSDETGEFSADDVTSSVVEGDEPPLMAKVA